MTNEQAAVDEMYRAMGRFGWRLSRYRQANAVRTKAALQAKLARGERAGNVRYGYQLSADGRTMEPCEAEQAVIAIVISLRESGYKLRQLADELNRRGLRTRRGSPWRFQYVRNVTKRAVAGNGKKPFSEASGWIRSAAP